MHTLFDDIRKLFDDIRSILECALWPSFVHQKDEEEPRCRDPCRTTAPTLFVGCFIQMICACCVSWATAKMIVCLLWLWHLQR